MLFSTLYNTLPHNLIKINVLILLKKPSMEKACNNRNGFFTSKKPIIYQARSSQNVYDVLIFLLDNIFIPFGTKVYRQVVVIPMGTKLCSLGCGCILVLL